LRDCPGPVGRRASAAQSESFPACAVTPSLIWLAFSSRFPSKTDRLQQAWERGLRRNVVTGWSFAR
jgi:hypothetical protein